MIPRGENGVDIASHYRRKPCKMLGEGDRRRLQGKGEHTCRSSLASEMAMTPAEHPMPPRLYDTMLDRILKWLMIIADREGVGLNRLQFTIRMSTCTPTDIEDMSSHAQIAATRWCIVDEHVISLRYGPSVLDWQQLLSNVEHHIPSRHIFTQGSHPDISDTSSYG